MRFPGKGRKTLELHLSAICLCVTLLLCVFLDPVEEVIPALGVTDMLDTKINTLFQVTISDDLVDDDTDGTRSDVEDDTSTAVVVLVGH